MAQAQHKQNPVTARQATAYQAPVALSEDLIGFILQGLEARDALRVRDLTANLHKGDIAELLHVITPEQRRQLIETIHDTLDPEVLVELEGEVKEQVISHLGAEESAAAITQLDHDEAVQVMEDLTKADQGEILESVPEGRRKALEAGLALPEDAAGRIMDTHFVAVPEDWDVGQAIDFLRAARDLPDDFYAIYLVNAHNHPVGSVLASRILRHRRDVPVRSIMEVKLTTVQVTMDQEEVAYMFRKYGLVSAPVVDGHGALAGVISIDNIMTVIEEEAEEDIMRLGGVMETDLRASALATTRHRFPWLFVNLLTAFLDTAVISLFEDAITKVVALAALMPIIAGMSGNAGTQTMTVAVRGLAMHELTLTNRMRIILKEVQAGLLNGLILGIITAVCTYIYYGDFLISLILMIAMVIALGVAALAGVLIPLMLLKLRVDPAVVSTIFLTTVTDVTSFFCFLGLATWWLL